MTAAVTTAKGHRWLAPASVGVAAAAGCVLLGVTHTTGVGTPLCPFKVMTGLDCPGCGMTRGLNQLVRGHVGTAIDYNVLLVLAVPVLLYVYVTWLASTLGVRMAPLRIGRNAYLVLGALAIGFSVLRNLPVGVGRYLNSDPGLR